MQGEAQVQAMRIAQLQKELDEERERSARLKRQLLDAAGGCPKAHLTVSFTPLEIKKEKSVLVGRLTVSGDKNGWPLFSFVVWVYRLGNGKVILGSIPPVTVKFTDAGRKELLDLCKGGK